jgi:transposase
MKRRRYTKEFKAKVALEAIKGQKTINEIASEFGCACQPDYSGGRSHSIWKGQIDEDIVNLIDSFCLIRE